MIAKCLVLFIQLHSKVVYRSYNGRENPAVYFGTILAKMKVIIMPGLHINTHKVNAQNKEQNMSGGNWDIYI